MRDWSPQRPRSTPPSKGRAGLADTNALGQYVVWITDDCYQTYGAGSPFLVASVRGLFAAPTITCVPVQARNDLFENQKPSYLMSLGEITDRAERLNVADRLGRTGDRRGRLVRRLMPR